MKNTFKKMMALGLMVAMVGTTVVPAGAASSDPNASAAREAANSAISQKAATQGSVLLDNAAGALPFPVLPELRLPSLVMVFITP